MKRLPNARIIKDNRLVLRVWDKDQKRIISQGKRVGKDCPLSAEERKEYVKGGAYHCALLMRKVTRPHLSLSEISKIIKSATGTGGL